MPLNDDADYKFWEWKIEQEKIERQIKIEMELESRRLGGMDGLIGEPVSRPQAPDKLAYDDEFWKHYKPPPDLLNNNSW